MSDFERTFGAGTDLESIIDGFSYVSDASAFDTSEIIFYNYRDALEFIREDTDLILRVSSETYEEHKLMFDVCLEKKPPKIITREIYKVSRLREGEYIRVTPPIKEECHCKATPQVFTLTAPYDPDQATWMNHPFNDRLLKIIESNEITLESIMGYFAENGDSQRDVLTRKPRDLSEIHAILESKNMELVPISETASVIFLDEWDVCAALVTEGDCTYLVQNGFSCSIYNILA